MTRVAIYARFSSDLQRDASIEDQIRLCRERAQKEGWSVTEVYADYAISGDTLIRRPAMQSLFQDGMSGKFDLILSEALDRLSRDQEEIAGVYKRMTFCGVRMFTLAEGEITELHIGLKGTMNALYVKDMARKVHRGQRGRVEEGKAGGGLSYGYDVVKQFDERGELLRGERKVNDHQANIVRRIFKEYSLGKSPRAIAADLNEEGVPGPRSKGWSPSTINGNWQRGSGILNNDLYNGEIVWNKVRYIKNPDTGKHVTRINPEEEWIRKEVSHLRIVDSKTWDKVKSMQTRRRIDKSKFWKQQRPKYLFSFLLKCGCCGGGMCKMSHAHYGCSTARNKGKAMCTNRRTIRQDDLEYTVLSILQHRLMDPKLLEVFCREYTDHVNRLRMKHNASINLYKSELGKLERKEKRLMQAIMDGYASEKLKSEWNGLAERQAELKKLILESKEAPVLLHPKMAERYRQEVSRLVVALNNAEHRHEATELIRSLIEKIVLTPDPDSPGLLIDLHGDLAGILNIATEKKGKEHLQELDLKQIRLVVGLDNQPTFLEQVKLVGPEGFEPPTNPL